MSDGKPDNQELYMIECLFDYTPTIAKSESAVTITFDHSAQAADFFDVLTGCMDDYKAQHQSDSDDPEDTP